MKQSILILTLLFSFVRGDGQVIFKIIVPQKPVIAGQSFQVQYVLEDADKKDEFNTPNFKGFNLVSGPYVYGGSAPTVDGIKKLKNIVFALVAPKPGRFVVPAASATVNGMYVKSDYASIEVISEEAATEKLREKNRSITDVSFLQPGEDPYEKIRRNLFIKVAVNKKVCYAGEPVTATYKLYSRLRSKSDIVKNPGFYGFTVQDMINLDDKVMTTEMINGKPFDVHTIRKVQLFPLQPGSFAIDEMEVENTVYFSKSSVASKTEQEIEEGVFEHGKEPGSDVNTVSFEKTIATEPVMILVKALPARHRPAEFLGATGYFSISAALEKSELSLNEEGDLIVTISGSGNFTQLSAPVIQWPGGVEGFDPVIRDELDKTQYPLSGKRIFRYPFTVSKSGAYQLPPIRMSFFKPDSNSYKTIDTKPITVNIVAAKQTPPPVKEQEDQPSMSSRKGWHWWMIGSIAIAALIVLLVVKKTKFPQKQTPVIVSPVVSPVHELLQPADILLHAENNSFYTSLRSGIWTFLDQRFELKGSVMNKQRLRLIMQGKGIDVSIQDSLLGILDHCETGIFTNVDSAGDKKNLLAQAKTVLEKIEKSFGR